MRSRRRAPRSGGPRPAARGSGGERSWPRRGSRSGSRDGTVRPLVHSRWWRGLQWAGGVLVVAFVVRYVVSNWAQVRAQPIEWRISPTLVASSLLLVLATYGLLIESWRRMLAGWGPRLPWSEAARVWVLSSMGKYLPGKVWAIAGMAMLARRRGVPAWAATASAILLQVVSIGT